MKKITRPIQWLLTLLYYLLLSIPNLPAAEPLTLLANQPQLSLASHLNYWHDPTATATLEQAMANPENFAPLPGFLNRGFASGAHWIKLVVQRHPLAPQDWILELGPAFVDDIVLYVQEESQVRQQAHLGDHVPFAQRPMQTRLHATPLTVPGTTPVTLWLRLESISAIALTGSFRQPLAMIASEARNNAWYGMYFGILGVIAVVYGAFGTWLRSPDMLSYAAYVTSLIIMNMGHGLGAIFFTPQEPWLLDLMTGGGVMLAVASASIMWDRMLDMKTNFPWIHRLFMLLALCALLALPAVTNGYYRLTAPPIQAMSAFIGHGGTLMLLILWYRKGLNAELLTFFLAFMASNFAVVQVVFMNLGFLERNAINEYAYPVSTVAHVLLLSFALGQRLRRIQQGKLLAEQQAQIATQRATEQRRFVGMLSHEFRTPLTAMDKAAQMIQLTAPALDEGARLRLEKIRSHAKRLYGYIDLFLTSEALDHGSLVLTLQPVAVPTLLEGIIQDLETPHRVRLVASVAEEPIPLDGDLFRIAVGNLIHNGLKYSPANCDVTVTVEQKEASLQVRVQDLGRGMAPEELAQIGNLYFRGSAAKEIKGIGLGVSLARRIITGHGGALVYESTPGQGTLATVTVPWSRVANRAVEAQYHGGVPIPTQPMD